MQCAVDIIIQKGVGGTWDKKMMLIMPVVLPRLIIFFAFILQLTSGAQEVGGAGQWLLVLLHHHAVDE